MRTIRAFGKSSHQCFMPAKSSRRRAITHLTKLHRKHYAPRQAACGARRVRHDMGSWLLTQVGRLQSREVFW